MRTSNITGIPRFSPGAFLAVSWLDSNRKWIGDSFVTSGWTFYEGILKPLPGLIMQT